MFQVIYGNVGRLSNVSRIYKVLLNQQLHLGDLVNPSKSWLWPFINPE